MLGDVRDVLQDKPSSLSKPGQAKDGVQNLASSPSAHPYPEGSGSGTGCRRQSGSYIQGMRNGWLFESHARECLPPAYYTT